MDHAALSAHNKVSVEAVREGVPTAHELERWARAYPFRGFVDCVAARGDEGFVMFNNADAAPGYFGGKFQCSLRAE